MKETQVPRSLRKALAKTGIKGPIIARAAPDALPSETGAYLLLLGFGEKIAITRGKARETFPSGWYVYAGSAYGPGGIAARVGRHFRRDKPCHWHIDTLTDEAELHALAFPGGLECDLIAQLGGLGDFTVPAPGFGSSDCRTCESHLLAWRRGLYQPGSMP